jgi:hypothetical protein
VTRAHVPRQVKSLALAFGQRLGYYGSAAKASGASDATLAAAADDGTKRLYHMEAVAASLKFESPVVAGQTAGTMVFDISAGGEATTIEYATLTMLVEDKDGTVAADITPWGGTSKVTLSYSSDAWSADPAAMAWHGADGGTWPDPRPRKDFALTSLDFVNKPLTGVCDKPAFVTKAACELPANAGVWTPKTQTTTLEAGCTATCAGVPWFGTQAECEDLEGTCDAGAAAKAVTRAMHCNPANFVPTVVTCTNPYCWGACTITTAAATDTPTTKAACDAAAGLYTKVAGRYSAADSKQLGCTRMRTEDRKICKMTKCPCSQYESTAPVYECSSGVTATCTGADAPACAAVVGPDLADKTKCEATLSATLGSCSKPAFVTKAACELPANAGVWTPTKCTYTATTKASCEAAAYKWYATKDRQCTAQPTCTDDQYESVMPKKQFLDGAARARSHCRFAPPPSTLCRIH